MLENDWARLLPAPTEGKKPLEKRVTCEVVYCHSSFFELETIVSMTQPTTLFLHTQAPVILKIQYFIQTLLRHFTNLIPFLACKTL